MSQKSGYKNFILLNYQALYVTHQHITSGHATDWSLLASLPLVQVYSLCTELYFKTQLKLHT